MTASAGIALSDSVSALRSADDASAKDELNGIVSEFVFQFLKLLVRRVDTSAVVQLNIIGGDFVTVINDHRTTVFQRP